jgi:hypothetical protein
LTGIIKALLVRKPEGKRPLESLGTDGWIILKFKKKLDGMVWTHLV